MRQAQNEYPPRLKQYRVEAKGRRGNNVQELVGEPGVSASSHGNIP